MTDQSNFRYRVCLVNGRRKNAIEIFVNERASGFIIAKMNIHMSSGSKFCGGMAKMCLPIPREMVWRKMLQPTLLNIW
jgi:hypothetical protein